jgi:hypothetical protein
MTEYRAGQWEPVRSYDAPHVFIDGLFSDERAFGAVRDVLLAPQNLSALERETAVTRLKEKWSSNPLSDAVIDIATNPFVWASFLMTPALGAVGGAGVRLFNPTGKGYNALMKGPVINFMHTGSQMVDGSPADPAMWEFMRNLHHIAAENDAVIGEATIDMLKGLGIEDRIARRVGLDWHALERMGRHEDARKVQEVADALWLSLSGADKMQVSGGRLEWMPRFTTLDESRVLRFDTDKDMHKVGQKLYSDWRKAQKERFGPGVFDVVMPDGTPLQVKSVGTGVGKEGMQPIMIDGTLQDSWLPNGVDLEQYLRERGAWGFRNTLQKQNQLNYLEMFGTQEALDHFRATGELLGGSMADPNKLFRVWRHLKDVDIVGGMAPFEVDSLVSFLLSKEMRKKLYRGKMEFDDFMNMAVEGFESQVNLQAYMPRNFKTKAQLRDGILEDAPRDLGFSGQLDALTTTERAHRRVADQVFYHPEDLERIERTFGSTPTLRHMKHETENYWQTVRDDPRDQALFFHRINLDENLGRYYKQAAQTRALIADPSEFLLREQKRLIDYAVDELGFTVPDQEVYFPSYKKPGTKYKVTTPIMDIPEGGLPLGGASVADVLSSSVQLLRENNAPTARLLTESLIPLSMGNLAAPIGALENMTRGAQNLVGRFFTEGTALGDALAANDRTKWIAEGIRDWTQMEWSTAARISGSNLTGWLYKGALGLNPFSIMQNLFQPFMGAIGYTGGLNLIGGYVDALADLGAYARARTALGPRITQDQRDALLRKHIPFAEEAGITGDFTASLDAMSAHRRTPHEMPGWVQYGMDMTMKGFEKAEWLNRLAVAHATHRALGSPFKKGVLRESADGMDALYQMNRMVQETQFGAGVMNAPLLFTPGAGKMGDLFTHPLLRQFKTFMLRSFTSPFILPGRTGGIPIGLQAIGGPELYRVTNPLAASTLNLMRLGGYSAIAYEGLKNVLATDYSKSLFFSATFEGTGLANAYDQYDAPVLPIANPFDAPVIRSAWSALQGITIPGESQRLLQGLSMWVPGGVGLSKVLETLPGLAAAGPYDDILPVLRKRYADYTSPLQDGRVPVFDGAGRLLEYQDPTALISRGLGVDLSNHKRSGDVAHWLTTQRDQILEARQKMLMQLTAGDTVGAQRTANQFQARFGVPLTVSQAQLKNFLTSRSVPRTERILGRMPKEIRRQLTEAVGAEGLEMTAAQMAELETARARTEAFGRTQQAGHLMDEDIQQFLQQRDPETIEDRGYAPNSSYKGF